MATFAFYLNEVRKIMNEAKPLATVSLVKETKNKTIAVVIACICSFMVVADGSIINVSLYTIKQALLLSEIQMQWVVDIYLLCLGGFMLLASKLSDIYGRKQVLIYGIVIFTLASFIGGIARSGEILIFARALQGLGAAVLATSPLAIIVTVYDIPVEKERAIRYWAACTAMGSAFGVFIGGVLTTYLSWHWVMFINLPIGVILFGLVRSSFNSSQHRSKAYKLDWIGAISSTVALISFLYAITYSSHYGLNSEMTLMMLLVSFISVVIFISVEKTADNPLVKFSIFRYKKFLVGLFVVAMLGISLSSSLYFLALMLQIKDGFTPIQIGLKILPMAISLAIAALLSSKLKQIGFSQLAFIGNILSSIGFLLLFLLPESYSYYEHLLLPVVLIGCGNGLIMMNATNLILSDIPKKDSGLAAGLQNTTRQLSGAIGIALLSGFSQVVINDLNTSVADKTQAIFISYHYVFFILFVASLIAGFFCYRLQSSIKNSLLN